MIENSDLVRGEDYWILQDGSYSGQGGDNSAITLAYRVKYESWQTLFDYIRGFAWWDGTDLKREIAEEHPTRKGWRCNGNISYEPYKSKFSGGDEPHPEFMKLTATFQPLPYAFLTDDEVGFEWERYTSRETEYAPDLISSGQGFFKFVNSGTPLATAPTKNECIQIFTYTWHQVPVWQGDENPTINNANLRLPNHQNIIDCFNKLNSSVFDFYGYQKHTLLFLGAEKKLLPPSMSEELFTFYYDITFKMAYRNAGDPLFPYPTQTAMGWDWAMDWGADTYDLFTRTGTAYGDSQYGENDLSILWERDA